MLCGAAEEARGLAQVEGQAPVGPADRLKPVVDASGVVNGGVNVEENLDKRQIVP